MNERVWHLESNAKQAVEDADRAHLQSRPHGHHYLSSRGASCTIVGTKSELRDSRKRPSISPLPRRISTSIIGAVLSSGWRCMPVSREAMKQVCIVSIAAFSSGPRRARNGVSRPCSSLRHTLVCRMHASRRLRPLREARASPPTPTLRRCDARRYCPGSLVAPTANATYGPAASLIHCSLARISVRRMFHQTGPMTGRPLNGPLSVP